MGAAVPLSLKLTLNQLCNAEASIEDCRQGSFLLSCKHNWQPTQEICSRLLFSEFSYPLLHRHTSSWFSIQPTWGGERQWGPSKIVMLLEGKYLSIASWCPLGVPSCPTLPVHAPSAKIRCLSISEIKNDLQCYQLITLLLISLEAISMLRTNNWCCGFEGNLGTEEHLEKS